MALALFAEFSFTPPRASPACFYCFLFAFPLFRLFLYLTQQP